MAITRSCNEIFLVCFPLSANVGIFNDSTETRASLLDFKQHHYNYKLLLFKINIIINIIIIIIIIINIIIILELLLLI